MCVLNCMMIWQMKLIVVLNLPCSCLRSWEMSEVWNTLVKIQDRLIERFDATGTEIQEPGMDRFNQPGWINRVWSSDNYRRAHVDVVDARDTKGLWMMHCCVFPHLDSDAPIFGLDVIAGARKITGYFHDYSPTTNPANEMIEAF